MSLWALAKTVARDDHGEPVLEYFTGEEGRRGGPSRSPFWADATKFHDAASAYECARTHRELRDSDEWRAVRLSDRTNPGRPA